MIFKERLDENGIKKARLLLQTRPVITDKSTTNQNLWTSNYFKLPNSGG